MSFVQGTSVTKSYYSDITCSPHRAVSKLNKNTNYHGCNCFLHGLGLTPALLSTVTLSIALPLLQSHMRHNNTPGTFKKSCAAEPPIPPSPELQGLLLFLSSIELQCFAIIIPIAHFTIIATEVIARRYVAIVVNTSPHRSPGVSPIAQTDSNDQK